MNGNIQLKCSNYVAFSHFHGEAVNNIGLGLEIIGRSCRGVTILRIPPQKEVKLKEINPNNSRMYCVHF